MIIYKKYKYLIKMKNKNGEDIIEIIYKKPEKIQKGMKNKIKIFDSIFVSNNMDKCKIIYKDKELKLTQYLKVKDKDLISIKLKGISSINDTSYMFYKCHSFISLSNIANWNTINVIKMNNMFDGCESLITISESLSNWNISNVNDISYMFHGCKLL